MVAACAALVVALIAGWFALRPPAPAPSDIGGPFRLVDQTGTPVDERLLRGKWSAVFFGFIVATVGCYQGYHASGGGRGVGLGTTRAVVIAMVSTVVMDYFLSDILLSLFPSVRGGP